MAVVTLFCAADGIEGLDQVQACPGTSSALLAEEGLRELVLREAFGEVRNSLNLGSTRAMST